MNIENLMIGNVLYSLVRKRYEVVSGINKGPDMLHMNDNEVFEPVPDNMEYVKITPEILKKLGAKQSKDNKEFWWCENVKLIEKDGLFCCYPSMQEIEGVHHLQNIVLITKGRVLDVSSLLQWKLSLKK